MADQSADVRRFSLARDTLLVRGPDRKTWLDGLLTCAVAEVADGRGGYGLLLTKQGKIVTDAFLLDSGAELFVGVAPGKGPSVRELLDRYLVMEDAELDRPVSELGWTLAVAPDEAPALVRGVLVLGRLRFELAARPLAMSAGLPDAAELFAQHGLGVFGVDFGEQDNPHEASLDRLAVSWTKGCYLGQEVVCMQDMRGKVKRRLVALDGGPALLAPDGSRDVQAADGSVVGQVSSIHPRGAGARVLASIAAAALESPSGLTLRGQPLRVAEPA